MAGILAHKIEMTRVIKDDKFIPVTLLSVPALKVVAIKTVAKDGYDALVIGILSDKKEGKLKEEKKALSHSDFDLIKEVQMDASEVSKYTVWDDISLDILDGIDTVKIEGTSKGHGFTGAMKKWNFHWGRATHGSKFHRALGSIGTRKPRRTKPGQKMHGHMGVEKITMKWVKLELVNKDIRVIGLRWGVPGSRNSLVHIIF